MKVFITGSNGKLGKEILKFLSFKKIYCIANYRKKKNFSIKNKYIKNYYCDILSKNFSFKNADVLIHCAGDVNKTKIGKKKNYRINKKINKLIKKNKEIKKLIFLSTVSVYSNFNFQKKIDERSKCLSKSYYAKEKLNSEKMFLRNKNIEIYNLRIPGVVFTKKEENFFSNLVLKIKKNQKKIILYNPNQLFNNILSITSLNKFILNLVLNKYKSGNILLGSSSAISIKSVVKKICNYFKNNYNKIKWLKLKNQGFYLNIDNAKNNYNFMPLKTERVINKYLREIKYNDF